MPIQTINPVTEKVIAIWEYMSEAEVFHILALSAATFTHWSLESFENKARYVRNVANILSDKRHEYGKLITLEMGKPLKASMEEIDKCALVCNHFADKAQEYLAARMIKTEMSKSYVAYKPLGSIFAIMPWNFPFWQVFRFAAPALMAGNCALLKHAPNTTACGLEIEKIFREAGFPEHAFRTLVVDNALAARIIQRPEVAAVTLTGSNQTGEIVASLAGNSLKKIVVELGGNDPYLILEDADLNLAAEAILTSRMSNSGQSCIAAKRILAVDAIREPFQDLVLQKLRHWNFGDPADLQIKMGPLARADLRAHLHQQIVESVAKGAKILQGGMIPDGPGFYYPPTVLTEVRKGMPAYEEELFGPVITFINVKDEEEAITIANDTQFGLSAAIFSKNHQKAELLALNKLHAGTVYVNDFVRSDPRLPFGGIKASGFGRELSAEGIREFVNTKTIGIQEI